MENEKLDLIEKHKHTPSGIGIPIEVACNCQLTQTEKILFGYIQNLSKSSKGCWASNKYLGKVVGVGEQSISNSLSNLQNYQYIIIELSKSPQGINRHVFLNPNYLVIYKPLVEIFYDNLDQLDADSLLKKLYTSINQIIDPYKKNYRKKEYIKEELKEPFSNEKGRCFSNTDLSSSETSSQMEKDTIKKPSIDNQSDIPETINGKPSIVAIMAKNGKRPIDIKQPIRKLNRQPVSKSTEILKSKTQIPSLSERASAGIKETCNKKAKPRKSKQQPLQIKTNEEDVSILIEHWNELRFKIHDPEKATVSYNKDIKALRKIKNGTLITGEKRKFNLEDVKTSMDRFALLIFNDEYGPNQAQKDHLSKIGLCDFLYNPYMKNTSWFLECFNKIPEKKISIIDVPDLHPNITNALKKHYKQYVFGNGLTTTFNSKEERSFREAANWICDYYEKKKYQFRGLDGGMKELASLFCQSIEKQYSDITWVHPRTYSSKISHDRMFAFMKQQGYYEG